jgi:hypothetical protein
MATGFFWDERCFWHSGGNYAFMAPVGAWFSRRRGPDCPKTPRRSGG